MPTARACCDNPATRAKPKATWQWRGQKFASREDLLAELKRRARDAAQGVLGPPVDELQGADRQFRSVRVKVQVSLGAWPPRTRRGSGGAAAAGTPGKGKQLKRPGKAAAVGARRRTPFE